MLRVTEYPIKLPDSNYLDTSARLRRMSRLLLIETLLQIVMEDQLILSILDDEDKVIQPSRRTRISRLK